MRDFLRPLAQSATAAAILTLLVVTTHLTASDPTEGALLRIAIRTTAGTMQDCRKLGAAELEALPVHMRRPEVCESRAVPYRLEVGVGDRQLLDRTYTASGIRGDRPLTVDEEVGLPAGMHDVSIRFTPAVVGDEHKGGSDAAHISPAFVFHGVVEFSDARIRIATLDAKTAAFEIR